MISLPRKTRRYLTVGLMLVFMPGLLWDAGQFVAGMRAVRKQDRSVDSLDRIAGFGPAEAYAAESGQPALVRKKLPELIPAAPPIAEPQPTPQPSVQLPAAEPEKPTETAASEPAPPAAVPLPEPVSEPAPSVASPVPAKAQTPKPEPKPIDAARAAYPFSILLSSCREKENALAALPGYRQTGLTPYLVQTDLGSKGIWWRTLTGNYRTLAEATQARNMLKLADAVVVKTPYANLIGQYGSEAEAAAAAARITQKDVFPYMVKGPGASFQLLAGAFPSQQAAETYRRELDAKGVSTRTVQR